MDINAQAHYYKRLNATVHSLGALLTYTPNPEDGDDLIVLAKMRRLSLCFVAFIHYAAEKAGVTNRERELLDYEELLEIIFTRAIIPASDKDQIEELYAMYSDIISYDPMISIDFQELEQHIPHMHSYLVSFITRESMQSKLSFVQEVSI
jgi:hypothetical protein